MKPFKFNIVKEHKPIKFRKMKTLKTIIITAIILVSINAQAQVTLQLTSVDVVGGITNENREAYKKMLVEQDSFRVFTHVKIKLKPNGLYKKIVFGEFNTVLNSFKPDNVFRFKPSLKNNNRKGNIDVDILTNTKRRHGKVYDTTFIITANISSLDVTIRMFSNTLNGYVDLDYVLVN